MDKEQTINRLAVAVSAWNQRSRLLCGECKVFERSTKNYAGDATKKSALAAEMFFRHGWRFTDMALCPQCAKKHLDN
jgi:hypothetical protein